MTQENVLALDEVRNSILRCQRCRLWQTCTRRVPGIGPKRAYLAIIGEAPGREEDQVGEPFVGAAGRLLTSTLEKCGFSRKEALICNVVCCRPPQNRAPYDDEIKACSDHLIAQLRSVDPKVLLLLGATAFQAFYPGGLISKSHGEWRVWPHPRWYIVPTWHPAAVLRDPRKLLDFESEVLGAVQLARATEALEMASLLLRAEPK